MSSSLRSRSRFLRFVPLLGVAATAFLSTAPASAQSAPNACIDAGGAVQVQFLQIASGNSQVVAQEDGTFVGPLGVRVYCSTDGQDIPNSQVALLTSVPKTTINGQPATCPNTYTGSATNIYIPDPSCTPATVSLPTGRATLSVASADPGLKAWEWFARVGLDQVTVVKANNQTVSGLPNLTAGIFARTPELGSVVLFGTGAFGMASYGLLRLRAARRRDDSRA